jgi:imidazolonepropionase-like amidohydrolase
MADIKFINAGWLIDGTGGPVREKVRLRIENGRIVSITDFIPGNPDAPAAADLTSYTVLPCLVDSHVHLSMSGNEDPSARKKQLDAGFDEVRDLISERLKRHLSFGVLAVRDGGDKYAHLLRYLNECRDVLKMPVVIKRAGRAWHRDGRYGGLIGRPVEKSRFLAEEIENDPEEKDQIKIVNSGLNSLKEFGKETLPQFGREELIDAVRIARKIGRRVMVHANGKKPVAAAVEAGCDSIEHGFFMGIENLKLMAEKSIVWVPTVCTMRAYARHMKSGSLEQDISRRNLYHQLEQISKAKELGVMVALGTDSGSTGVHHGEAVKEEIGLLMQGGYSLQEAVKCASFNGARLLGIKNFGVIARGMDATFIAAKGSPSRLFSSAWTPEFICIKGIFIGETDRI